MPEQLQFKLRIKDFKRLNNKFPKNQSSAAIGKRAIEIVRIYFKYLCPHTKVKDSKKPGVDLLVPIRYNHRVPIEVKGTISDKISLGQIKVSGDESFKNLANKKMPIYRVVGVYQSNPRIFKLICGKDFDLEKEPRWRFKSLEID